MPRIACAIASILCVIIIPWSISSAGPATVPVAYVTPADVFAAAIKAGRGGDFQTYVNCMSPDCQEKLAKFALGMIFVAPTTAPSTSALDKEKSAFEVKWGLDHRDRRAGERDAQLVDRIAARLHDKSGFLVDLMSHERAHDKYDPKSDPMPELADLEIAKEGATATGKLVQHDANGDTMSMDVQFKRIDNSWKIDSIICF